MVFVHSRKDTVKTAEMLRFRFQEEEDLLELIDPKSHPRFELYKRDLISSRNREMKELMELGFG
jgi:replicative superfamily II helicase